MKHAIPVFILLTTLFTLNCSNIPDSFSDEKILPSGSFIVNEGYSYTLSDLVTLDLSVTGAEDMCFSTDGVNYSEWEDYGDTKDITLPAGHGVKTVYARFRNTHGVTEISEDIIPLREEKILASDGASDRYFGGGTWSTSTSNLALSYDGNTMITASVFARKVYIYTRTQEGWSEMGIGSPDGSSAFGHSVTCTPDAGYIVVSARGGSRVYIFRKNSSGYVLENTINSLSSTTDLHTVTVSISDDGSKIVAGYYQHLTRGIAFLYEKRGEDWTSYTETAFSPPEGDILYMGFGVKISGDGSTIVIGAPGSYANKGALFVYRWNGSGWNRSELLASDGINADLLGRHIGISRDGTRIIAGTRCWTSGNHNQGAAYLFEWNGSQYMETHKFMASNGVPDDLFGLSVAMTADGNTVVIGSPFVQGSTVTGRAYVFTFRNSIWTEEAILGASDGVAGEYYGNVTAISGNGQTIAVSASMDIVGSSRNQGSVYLYY